MHVYLTVITKHVLSCVINTARFNEATEDHGSTNVVQIGRSLVRSQLVSLEFFIEIKSFRSHYGPGVDSASNRNEYQEHFMGVKSGRCVRLTTLPQSCAVVTKSGSLNFLEPSGPLQACNGTDIPLPAPPPPLSSPSLLSYPVLGLLRRLMNIQTRNFPSPQKSSQNFPSYCSGF